MKKCPSGTQAAENSNECKKCGGENCDVCTPTGKCAQCVDDFYLDKDGKCVATCPRFYFEGEDALTGAGKCRECARNCLSCKDDKTCDECREGTHLFVSIKPALSNYEFQEKAGKGQTCANSGISCPTFYSTYKDGACQSCEVGCA